MRNLNRTLRDSDPALLPMLAEVWGVDISTLNNAATIIALTEAMLTSERGERVWDKLDEAQRGALQTLISFGGTMPMAKFERLFGTIRQMGAAQLEREQPHKTPATTAEALYYRGLIAQAFEQIQTGPRAIAYVPDDMKAALPVHKTAYENLEPFPTEAAQPVENLEALDLSEIGEIQQADTSLIDDLTTLLAFLQVYGSAVEADGDVQLARVDRDALSPHLLSSGVERLALLLGLGLTMNLIDIQGGRAYPKRAEARRWLEASRSIQVRQLAEAWLGSDFYRDLWHVPHLHLDTVDGYDPSIARDALMGFLGDLVPKNDWWSLEAFIAAVKEVEPDFQRPDGMYDSWYIRNEAGEFLSGFESWDAVEGALLEFYILGPMHWLGLVDLADDAARLTAYGRAFLNAGAWPDRADPDEKSTLQPDGVVLISRRAPRIDRFQIARFTTWGRAASLKDNTPYTYLLDEKGTRRAAEQGIHAEHITGFLTRVTGLDKLPQSILDILGNARSGPTGTVQLEHVFVLRTTAPETLDFMMDTPALRRFLGARLGPMAVVARKDNVEALLEALTERGIEVEVLE